MVRRGEAPARKTDARGPDPRESDRASLARRISDASIDAVTSLPAAKVAEITQQWCAKAALDPDAPVDSARILEAMALASFLALFTPGPPHPRAGAHGCEQRTYRLEIDVRGKSRVGG